MTVLMMLGAVPFQVAPLNMLGSKFKGDFDFAEHKVLGAAPIYENMGEGERERTLKGETFPNTQNYLGGERALQAIEAMRRRGSPQHLIRGDGLPYGWFLITSLTLDYDRPALAGVSTGIKFDISLTQCESPSVADFASVIGSFFS